MVSNLNNNFGGSTDLANLVVISDLNKNFNPPGPTGLRVMIRKTSHVLSCLLPAKSNYSARRNPSANFALVAYTSMDKWAS